MLILSYCGVIPVSTRWSFSRPVSQCSRVDRMSADRTLHGVSTNCASLHIHAHIRAYVRIFRAQQKPEARVNTLTHKCTHRHSHTQPIVPRRFSFYRQAGIVEYLNIARLRPHLHNPLIQSDAAYRGTPTNLCPLNKTLDYTDHGLGFDIGAKKLC